VWHKKLIFRREMIKAAVQIKQIRRILWIFKQHMKILSIIIYRYCRYESVSGLVTIVFVYKSFLKMSELF
jgi:hypothetical protein